MFFFFVGIMVKNEIYKYLENHDTTQILVTRGKTEENIKGMFNNEKFVVQKYYMNL